MFLFIPKKKSQRLYEINTPQGLWKCLISGAKIKTIEEFTLNGVRGHLVELEEEDGMF